MNQVPRAIAIPSQTVFVGDTGRVILTTYFSDPDGDALTFAAASSHPDLGKASVKADTLLLAALRQGDATITVTATDPGGRSASQTVGMLIPNRRPEAIPIPDWELFAGDSLIVAVGSYFSDPDGDHLVYGAESSNPDTLAVAVAGDTVLLAGLRRGGTTVTVTATDPGGLSASRKVRVVVDVNQRAVLEALYHTTDGPNWKRSDNWLSDAPLEEWYGIRRVKDGQIKHLRLSDNGLSGSIPPQLGDIASINDLNLRLNNLSGPIPPELASIELLQYLDLTDNSLSGPIPPELGNLTKLRSIALSGNNLSGPIPPELGNITSFFNTLSLGDNDLSGPIPPELGNLTYLRRLSFRQNDLSGPIPPELGNLIWLESLDLSGNSLSGPIPPELGNLTKLKYLYLPGKDLCAPDDPQLRQWLIGQEVYLYPCVVDPNVRLLPRSLMREDGNGLSLALPDDLRDPSTIMISDSSVVAASVSDGWLELSPQARGSAEVEVISGDNRAIAGAVVRASVGTFGIDIVMDQPAPVGYEEATTIAADWWSAALDGTEWPDRMSRCHTKTARGIADELLIQAGLLEPRHNTAAIAKTCFNRGSSANVVFDPGGGRIETSPGFAGDVDIIRHEIGHLLGLVAWTLSTGLLTVDDRLYFVGDKATEVFHAGGGDSQLPGVPLGSGFHWFDIVVNCELMVFYACGLEGGLTIDAPDAISLAALADAGYTVDMSKATPWPRSNLVQADVGHERFVDHVIIEWFDGTVPPP